MRAENGPQSTGNRTGDIARMYVDHGADLAAGQGSYGMIYTVLPAPGAMAAFAAAMSGASPPIRLLIDTPQRQVVAATYSRKTYTGYAAHAAGTIPADGPVAHIDAPCLVMTRAIVGTPRLELAVADPDVHIDRTEANPFGWSVPTPIQVTLRGNWRLEQAVAVSGIKPPQVRVDPPRDGPDGGARHRGRWPQHRAAPGRRAGC